VWYAELLWNSAYFIFLPSICIFPIALIIGVPVPVPLVFILFPQDYTYFLRRTCFCFICILLFGVGSNIKCFHLHAGEAVPFSFYWQDAILYHIYRIRESICCIVVLRGFFKKFPHFYIFAGNGEGGRSSNWLCLRVSCD